METWLLWLYLITAALLILHEMDSVYWQEWKLFRLPGGVTFFLLLHLPLLILVLYGLLEVQKRSPAGPVFSLVLALSGMAAFIIHQAFLRKGHKEFSTTLSQGILLVTLFAALGLLTVAILTLVGNR